MEFHIGYWALRSESTPAIHSPSNDKVKPGRMQMDLSWLRLSSHDQSCAEYRIHEAQISFVVCGSDKSRWITYAFVDNDLNEDGPRNCSDAECCNNEDELERGTTVFNPREYFLHIVKHRLSQIMAEWTYLVRKVEKAIQTQVRHLLIQSAQHGEFPSCSYAEDISNIT